MLDKSYLDQDHTDLDMIFNNQQDDNGGSINILNWEMILIKEMKIFSKKIKTKIVYFLTKAKNIIHL
jgi:hypothetical protein